MGYLGVSVVVLNWQGGEVVNKCISSLLATNYPDDRIDIVVVDNNSTDGSFESIKSRFLSDITLLSLDKNYGFSKANNVAMNYILNNRDSDYIILLNNDIIPGNDDWLKDLLDVSGKIGIIGCRLTYPDGSVQHGGARVTKRGGEIFEKEIYSDPTRFEAPEYILGACMAINRELISEIGFLDEAYTPYNWEEVDYCMRCHSTSFDVIFNPNATLIHKDKHSKSSVDAINYYYNSKKNRVRYMMTNENLSKMLQWLFYEQYRDLGYLFQYNGEKNWKNIQPSNKFKKRVKKIIKSYFVNIRNIEDMIYKRRNRRSKISGSDLSDVYYEIP